VQVPLYQSYGIARGEFSTPLFTSYCSWVTPSIDCHWRRKITPLHITKCVTHCKTIEHMIVYCSVIFTVFFTHFNQITSHLCLNLSWRFCDIPIQLCICLTGPQLCIFIPRKLPSFIFLTHDEYFIMPYRASDCDLQSSLCNKNFKILHWIMLV
jgi:hypothetical protein